MSEHLLLVMDGFFDRSARALRPVILLASVAAVPVFLMTYWGMLKLAFQEWGALWFAITVTAHIIVWLGCSMLHDWQKERHQMHRPPKRGRQLPPDAL